MNVWYHGASCGASSFALGDVSISVALIAVAHGEWGEARITGEELFRDPPYGAFGVYSV